MHLSISGTCSFADALFSFIPYDANPSRVHSNWLSSRITVTENTPFLYELKICFREVIRVSCLTFLIISAATNLIAQEVLIKYGTLFTNIMSTATITSLYCNSRSGEIFNFFRLTDLVFPGCLAFYSTNIWSENVFGSQNVILINWVIWQGVSLAMLLNCLELDLPIILRILCARVAFE